RQVPAQYDFRAHAREPGRQNGRPIIPSVPCMNDLDLLLPKETGCAANQRDFERPERERMKRDSKLLSNLGKLASCGTCQPDVVTQLHDCTGSSDRAIVGAAAFEQGV